MADLVVSVADYEYSVVLHDDGSFDLLRYGEQWSNEPSYMIKYGNMIRHLAFELAQARGELPHDD